MPDLCHRQNPHSFATAAVTVSRQPFISLFGGEWCTFPNIGTPVDRTRPTVGRVCADADAGSGRSLNVVSSRPFPPRLFYRIIFVKLLAPFGDPALEISWAWVKNVAFARLFPGYPTAQT